MVSHVDRKGCKGDPEKRVGDNGNNQRQGKRDHQCPDPDQYSLLGCFTEGKARKFKALTNDRQNQEE